MSSKCLNFSSALSGWTTLDEGEHLCSFLLAVFYDDFGSKQYSLRKN